MNAAALYRTKPYFHLMMRVDTVPWYLRPFFLLFGYGGGLFFYVYCGLIHLTCSIRFMGAPIPAQPAIYCIWHRDLVLYFGVFNSVKKQVWMNHPAWYMKPVHVLLRWRGVEYICLGSSGNSGKEALENVISYLKQGYSTTIASDGPAGPVQVLKPGVLWMSRDAHVPVVPLHFSCSSGTRLGGWDGKVLPRLFSEITVTVGESIQVNESNLEASGKAIAKHLDQ
jgi:lysophospholipid acyltransferase (LPLAT)-like uncharacterized protein